MTKSTVDLNYKFTCIEEFSVPRPLKEHRENVLYSADGLAWSGVRVDEFCSIRRSRGAGLHTYLNQKFWARPLDQGTIIQGECPNTYGDWISEQVKCLCLVEDILEPVILPGFLGRRSYVQHEMKRLGIRYISLDYPVLIRQACVLHKPRHRTNWNKSEVEAFRKRIGHSRAAPERGSVLFLSRANVSSEQHSVTRDYKSEVARAAVEDLGGIVVETEGLNIDDFRALAAYAETVVADHGAAMFNILHWNTRNIVEIVSDNWWSNCFVVLGVACGVNNYAIVRCDARPENETRRLIVAYVRRFQRASKHGGKRELATSW